MKARDVRTGQVFDYPYPSWDTRVTVTVLKDAEPCVDRFGRNMVRFWALREDSGREGYMMFGPDAEIPNVKAEL